MSTGYTGVRVVDVQPNLINQLYKNRKIDSDFDARRSPFVQNEYVVVKSGQQTAITRSIGKQLVLFDPNRKWNAAGTQPRNKEQQMALDALLDDKIKVVVLTGRAGTGKTLLTLAAAMQKMDDKRYDRMILTRSMSWVGKHGLGALPGDEHDKFGPYLQNYMCNIEYLVGGRKQMVQDTIDQYKMEFVPIQLIRGASWRNTIIVADEVQTLGYDEMVALGTRVGEGSKIIIMGDLNQRDENISREKTGIFKFVNSPITMGSELVASIELLKCERSAVSALFASVFER